MGIFGLGVTMSYMLYTGCMSSVKRLIAVTVVFLIFLVLLFAGIYLFLSEKKAAPHEVPSDFSPPPSLGLDNITTTQPEQFSFDVEVSEDGKRDDRVYTVPLVEPSADEVDSEVVETEENIPRLIRLFRGPTAGYRINQGEDGVWEVKVVEQGRGDRYVIRTIPYSIEHTSHGEFTRVLEGHLFLSDDVLMLYESSEDEMAVRSAFVPFFTEESGTSIQRFEDNIRVATDNGNRLFFLQDVGDTSVGLVVDVTRPENTEVVWRSDFTSWIPRWGRNSHITLSSPVTKHMKGYVYLVDPDGDDPDTQFVSLSSGGSAFFDTSSGYFVLYEVGSDFTNFFGKTVISNMARDVDIEINTTLPEKCDGFNGVFVCAMPTSVAAETLSGYETMFPDSWYQGDLVLDDAFVLINAVTGEQQLLTHPEHEEIRILSNNAVFDAVNLQISDDGEFLFFVNRNDLSLWMLKLGA